MRGDFCGEHSCKHCINRREVFSDICFNCDHCYYYCDGQHKATVQEDTVLYGVVHFLSDDTFDDLLGNLV